MFDLMTTVYDRLTAPLLTWSPEWSCAVISAVIGVVLLFCFKFVSMQRRIEAVKNRMSACILGVWLYRDQPRMIARCQGAVVWHGLHYLALSLLPLLVFALPMTALLGQMHAYYAYRPISLNQSTLVTMTVDGDSLIRDDSHVMDVTLLPQAGLRVEAMHRDTAAGQVIWRVAFEQAPGKSLQFDVAGSRFEKHVSVGDGLMRVQPERSTDGFWMRLMFPTEPPLPAEGPVRSIRVTHSSRELTLVRWPCHWLWTCFAAMTVAILVLRRPMRVAI